MNFCNFFRSYDHGNPELGHNSRALKFLGLRTHELWYQRWACSGQSNLEKSRVIGLVVSEISSRQKVST